MGKQKGFNVITTWKARHNHNVRTDAAVLEDTLATLEDMVRRDIHYGQLFMEFVNDAGKAWARHEKDAGKAKKGEPVGVKAAKDANVAQAWWWEACRQQLRKYEFKKDGKPLMKGGKFILKNTKGSWTPSETLVKEAKALGVGKAQLQKDFKNTVDASLWCQKRRMEVAIQLEVDKSRKSGNFSEPIRLALKRIVEVAGLNVNIPEKLTTRTTQTIRKTKQAA